MLKLLKLKLGASEEKKEASVLYYPIYDATGLFFDGIKEELQSQNRSSV